MAPESSGSDVIDGDGELPGVTDIDASIGGEAIMDSDKSTPAGQVAKEEQLVSSDEQDDEPAVRNAPDLPKATMEGKSAPLSKSPPNNWSDPPGKSGPRRRRNGLIQALERTDGSEEYRSRSLAHRT